MTDYYVSSTEDVDTSVGNAGTLVDPMGLQEALNTFAAGDTIFIMDDGPYNGAGQLEVSGSGTAVNLKNVFGANSSGVEDGSKPTINAGGGNNFVFDDDPGGAAYYHFKNLILNDNNRAGCAGIEYSKFENLETSDINSRYIIEGCRYSLIIGCKKTGGHSNLNALASSGGDSVTMINCHAIGTDYLIWGLNSSRRGIFIHQCVADGCLLDGIKYGLSGQSGITVSNCIFMNGAGNGIDIYATSGASGVLLVNNICYNNAGNGFSVTTGAFKAVYNLVNNLCIDNGGYGYLWQSENRIIVENSYAYNNTSGPTSGGDADYGEITSLTADPFIDAASEDFLINDTAGGGTVLRAASSTGPTGFTVYGFRHLVDPLGSGGGTTAYFG